MASAIVSVIGLVTLSLSDSGSTYWTGVLPGLSLVALGSGLSYAPSLSLATAVPDEEQGVASGVVNTSQELGTAAGLAVLAAIAVAALTPSSSVITNYTAGYLAAAVTAGIAGLIALATLAHDPQAAKTAEVKREQEAGEQETGQRETGQQAEGAQSSRKA